MRSLTIRWLATAAMLLAASNLAAQIRGGSGLPPRDEWQNVPGILAALGDIRGKHIADVAAGEGYLTKHVSRAVGVGGRVYAVEIGEKELTALRALAQRDSFANVQVIESAANDPRLPSDLDGVVILNSYHELTDYKAMLAGIKRALRPGAPLVLVDNAAGTGWFTKRDDQASHHALDPKYVVDELREAGFEIADRRDDFITQPYAQWLIVGRRPH
jgi:predicted methyltransferase